MTKHFFPILLFMACILAISCNNGDDDPSGKGDPEGDCFTAKIDGELFEADNVKGTEIFSIINIGATYGTTEVPTFGVNINSSTSGTYELGSQTDVTAFYAPAALNSTEQFAAVSGSLTIEEHDLGFNTIKGTFNFTGRNADGETIEVTEGFFDLTYGE